jgi:adenine-specific DNA-methyltransferase
VPVLTADPAHSTVKPGAGEDDHVLIEGDNLTALTMLHATHKGKVNVIYIDPPYNTGNKDFVYNDRFVDPEDSYQHSKWLSFMRPRLVLARELLTSDGVIFVSIDDHEQAYLRVLMDEVFGERNKVNDFIWMNNLKGRQLSNGGAATTYEHILCYAKKPGTKKFSLNASYASNLMPLVYSKQKYRILKDEEGEYALKNELFNTNSKFNEQSSPSMVFNIHYNGHDVKFSSIDSDIVYDGYTTIHPHVNSDGEHRYHAWRWSKKKIVKDLKDLIFIKDGDKYKIYTKVRSFNETSMKDVISNISTGNIDSILGKHKFQNPKPVSLIKLLIDVSTSQSSLVLDFFAGSGTTGQAVAELNKEDGGHRKCILVTNNFEQDGAENGIARSVTAVRLRRVLTGEDWADGEKHDPLPGNLRYYRIGFKALADDADVFTGAFTAPGDIAGVIALARGTHDVVSAESLAVACPVLAAAVANGRAMVLTNGHGDRVLVYSDAVAVMNGDDEYEAALAEFREWAGDKGTVYLASLDESDDDGTVYPLPYVRIVRRTVNGLERQGLLAREK